MKIFFAGDPISKLVLYLPETVLLYLSNFNWSTVNKGLGSNWNNFAVNIAKESGNGNKSLFLLIKFNNFIKICLKVSTSGPTHSIMFVLTFFEITNWMTSVKSEQWIGVNFVSPL